MEPFTIQCSTCQSLIRVRNPKMIGQIVNCPKCNSMIQIAEPRQIRVESHRGVIDSSAMTKEAFAPELEDEYRLAPNEPVSESNPFGSNDQDALVAPPRTESPEFDEAFYESSMNAPPYPEMPQKAAHAALSPAAISQLSVQRKAKNRQVLMVAVLGLSGVLLAGLLFTAFLYWYSNKGPQQNQNQLAQNGANAGVTTPGPKREPASNNDSTEDAQLEQADAPESGLESEMNGGLNNSADAEANTNANSGATNDAKEPAASADGNKDLTSAIANAIDQSVQGGTPPNAVQPAAPEMPAAGSEVAAKAAATAELPEQLKKFENILNRSIEPQMIADEIIQKAPPTAEELGLTVGGDSKALPPVDVAAQLQLEISGFILPDTTPFSSAVSAWVQLSGVPTGVDLDSFAAAGLDPYRTIGIKEGTTKSLGDIGKSIAATVDADLIGINNQFLVFQAAETKIRDAIGSSMKVNDLVTTAEQEKWLVATLDQFIPQPPTPSGESVWKIKDGELISDPEVVNTLSWFWAVRVLESWRSAAKLESKLNGLRQDAFVTKFVDAASMQSLDKPMKYEQLERTLAAQLISNVSVANKMHTWIDWAATTQRGLGPGTVDMFVTKNRTLRQVLRDVTSKYGLVVAIENEQSLIVSSSQEYLSQPRLYVLPSEGKTVEQWLVELEPLTPASADGMQPVRAVLTPDSQFIIFRCCRPRLRN